MKNTYTVTAKSCENPNVTIEYRELCGECVDEVRCRTQHRISFRKSFANRQEEVVYSRYVGADWFTPFASYGEVIDSVYDTVACCENDEEEDEGD